MSPPRSALRHLLLLAKVGGTALLFVLIFGQDEFSWAGLVDELRRVELSRFLPWATLAVVLKLGGVFANVRRWQLLLRGQEIQLPFGFLCGSFFVGRFFGIVTPGTLGLDGFKLYDAIRMTRRPVACGAVLVIDKVVGLVSLATLLLFSFPVTWRLFDSLDGTRAAIIGGLAGIGTAGFFAVLLKPALTGPVVGLLPWPRLRGLCAEVHEASTAYSSRRGVLFTAVGLGTVGHLTTALMYWALLCGMSPSGGGGPGLVTVLFAALLMTSATLVAPTVGGEGVREYTFAMLLDGLVPQARSVLFGHAGFWIEKGLLGLPGGIVYLLRRSSYDGAVKAEDLARIKRPSGLDEEQGA